MTTAGLWIDGEPATPGLRMRWLMAKSSVTGVPHAPVLVTITPVADWQQVDASRQQDLERQIAALLEAHPDMGDQIQGRGARIAVGAADHDFTPRLLARDPRALHQASETWPRPFPVPPRAARRDRGRGKAAIRAGHDPLVADDAGQPHDAFGDQFGDARR